MNTHSDIEMAFCILTDGHLKEILECSTCEHKSEASYLTRLGQYIFRHRQQNKKRCFFFKKQTFSVSTAKGTLETDLTFLNTGLEMLRTKAFESNFRQLEKFKICKNLCSRRDVTQE